VYSSRKKFLIIPVFPKRKFLSQFLIKETPKGGLMAKAAVGQGSSDCNCPDPENPWYLSGSPAVSGLEAPFYFAI